MVGLAALGAALLLASTTIAGAGGLPTFTSPSRADTGEGHNEPATIVDRNGVRYVAYQGGSQLATTTDGGRTWKHFPDDVLTRKITPCTTGADDIGDVELATDQAGRTYFADLQATAGGTADNGVQPVVAHSNDAFLSYNAGRLREACKLFTAKMLDDDVTVGLSLSGALSPAGLGISSLVPLNTPSNRDFFSAIVRSTRSSMLSRVTRLMTCTGRC